MNAKNQDPTPSVMSTPKMGKFLKNLRKALSKSDTCAITGDEFLNSEAAVFIKADGPQVEVGFYLVVEDGVVEYLITRAWAGPERAWLFGCLVQDVRGDKMGCFRDKVAHALHYHTDSRLIGSQMQGALYEPLTHEIEWAE